MKTGDFSKVEAILPDFLKALDALRAGDVHPKQHIAQPGLKYMRIVSKHPKHEGGSAYCFLDTDGNIYMPDGWKRPAKHIRGSIFDANFSIGKGLGKYGPTYLR
jgi:hypothetical protein